MIRHPPRSPLFPYTPLSRSLVTPSADLPPLGVGEASGGPTVAAIGNAVAHDLGARLRDLPLTRDRVMAALLKALLGTALGQASNVFVIMTVILLWSVHNLTCIVRGYAPVVILILVLAGFRRAYHV